MSSSPNWTGLAERLAETFVEAASCRFSLSQDREPLAGKIESVGLAVSGGADSVCLALLAWANLPELRERLTVLHFNHRRRGEASDGDEAFVRELAEGLWFACQVGYSERTPDAAASEADLREERLAFFRESGCDIILQGHQRDDILETQLMRLCRGSGMEGLAAPAEVSRHGDGLTFLRPLLGVGRKEIREALTRLGIPWREDASNDTGDFLRNRIRHDVVPALREATGREPSVGAALSRELLAEDAQALDLLVRELFPKGFAGPALEMPPLRQLPNAVLRRAFYAWLAEQGITPERVQMEALLTASGEDEATIITLASGRRVAVSSAEARLIPEEGEPGAWPVCSLSVDGEVELPGGVLSVKRVRLDDLLSKKISAGQIDPTCECYLAVGEILPNELWARSWEPGDRYRPLGAPGTRKVQDIFTDAKIPPAERKRLPLVFWGDELVWIPGFAPAESHRVQDGTESALWLTYRAV